MQPDWSLSTETLVKAIDFYRQAAIANNLDYGDYWAICDEAAEIIEGLMNYEIAHGLRSPLIDKEGFDVARVNADDYKKT